MASRSVIASMNANSYTSLNKTIGMLAERHNLAVPNLNIHKRYDAEFRRAKELEAISGFLEELEKSLNKPTRAKRAPQQKNKD